MKTLSLDETQHHIDTNMRVLYQRKVNLLNELILPDMLNKNPYLLQVKRLRSAVEIVSDLLEVSLSSSEEILFGDFLKDLTVFVASKTYDGHKSTAPGVDLEFFNKGTHYVVSVKSGTNWNNCSQQNKLEEDLRNAVVRVKQSRHGVNVQSVLGICYGKTRTSYVRGYLKVVGQNFWYLISENENLYIDIVEPIFHSANVHSKAFLLEKSKLLNRLAKQFIYEFCDDTGLIDWVKLVEFNSGNYDLDRFLN